MSNQVKLPPINRTSDAGQPFKIPNDNQILLQKQPSKQIGSDKKIWQKKTASCRTALKRFDKYIMPQDNNFVPQYKFNTKDQKLIQSALQIIQMRKKNKDLIGKNETIVDILEQKKQMFLVTMTHQIIDKEINNLKDQASQRQKALKESNQILQQDIKDFDQYQQRYKAQTKQIEQRFEKQVQLRVAIQQDIKKQQIVVNSLRAQKARNQESISSYLKYKQFLDQLPPKEWILQKESKKIQKINQIRQKLLRQYEANRSSSSFYSNSNSGGNNNSNVIGNGNNSNVSNGNNKKSQVKEEFQKYFNKTLQSGQNQNIQQILYNEETYFKQPSEMIEYFNNLQETNLFCIQNSQYAEQKYQELKIQSEQKKVELQKKYQSLMEHKKGLDKQLNELDNVVRQLKKKKQQNGGMDQKDSSNIKNVILVQYQSIQTEMHSYMPDIQYKTQSLALLSAIEICMERLWEKLRQCYLQNPKAIKQIKTALQKKKNNEKRQEAARNNKIQQEKRKIRNLQKKQPIMKIQGRIDMKRSPPQEKIVLKKIETTGKDQDDDKKYLMD